MNKSGNFSTSSTKNRKKSGYFKTPLDTKTPELDNIWVTLKSVTTGDFASKYPNTHFLYI